MSLPSPVPLNSLREWDRRFMALAGTVAGWSKDPSTKCGAVIVDTLNRIRSLGFNGFPRGVADSKDRLGNRDMKYSMMVHAEPNAILNSATPVAGCCVYVYPFAPCSECAKIIIQSGITKVVAPVYPSAELQERWGKSVNTSMEMFREAGVKFVLVS